MNYPDYEKNGEVEFMRTTMETLIERIYETTRVRHKADQTTIRFGQTKLMIVFLVSTFWIFWFLVFSFWFLEFRFWFLIFDFAVDFNFLKNMMVIFDFGF